MELPDQVRLDLQWMARDFEVPLATGSTGGLDGATDGTGWTNPQLLWHMAFDQHIACALLPVTGGLSHLPALASGRYTSALSTATRPYNWVNFVGGAAGA